MEGASGLQTFGLTCSDVRLRMMLTPHTASASSVLCKTSGTAAVSWASRACDMRLVCVGGRCWQHTRARRLDERDAWRATRRPTMHIARNSSARKGRAPIPCENVVRSHVVRPPIMKFPENLDIRRDRQNAQPTPPLRCHHGVSCGQGCDLSKLRAKCTFRAPLPRIALHSTLTLSLGHYWRKPALCMCIFGRRELQELGRATLNQCVGRSVARAVR